MLCEREYWQRLWVVQELVLAPELTIQCGLERLAGLSFERRVTDLPRETRGIDRVQSLTSHRFCRRIYSQPSREIWTNCIGISKSGLCEDVRDRIYGVQGLVPQDAVVAVDYFKSTQDLYLEVLLKFVPLCRVQRGIYSGRPGEECPITKFGDEVRDALMLKGLENRHLARFLPYTISDVAWDGAQTKEQEVRNWAILEEKLVDDVSENIVLLI